ncbi:MOSC domain-containing protein [Sediminicola sp. 1XM1-17]|uniref:MOSC domain-containing protein n=1 Tax=Sediminicola sp. 1XM1-17 TaxID=3127702 RepID=UPI003076B99D
MKVIATNISKGSIITWKGKEEKTGIYKCPTKAPIHLGKTDVGRDTVVDRKYHGGIHKACYLFSAEEYTYWKNLYPQQDWDWGMFGENLTIAGLDESQIRIGDIYKIGGALVQISQPREPCYKLGIRFGTQKILKQFIARSRPGTYVRILEEGMVAIEDGMILKEQSKNSLTVQQLYNLLFAKEKAQDLLHLAINNHALPLKKRDSLKKYL